jgi:hypothetical protein
MTWSVYAYCKRNGKVVIVGDDHGKILSGYEIEEAKGQTIQNDWITRKNKYSLNLSMVSSFRKAGAYFVKQTLKLCNSHNS